MRGTVGVRARERIALLLAVTLMIWVASPIAGAVDVRGQLTVPPTLPSIVPAPSDAERNRGRYWEEWNGVLDPHQARVEVARELAVVLTGDGPISTGEQPPYRLHNGSLSPATLVMRAGTSIQVRNEDGISYELFSEGGELAPTLSGPQTVRAIEVAQPGSFAIRDRLHPHVRGHVHALTDLVARAFVEPDGSFSFRGVAAGSYRLRVFHGEREVTSLDVTVPEGATFTVPPIAIAASR